MFSAISFGVFCRLAPSTSAIIRSMKLSPGFWVISTTIRSESTLVPPVTELRSPPLSRMTGALSPVMALSSTLAMPSMTSPSPGMTSPASHTTRSPCCSCGAGTGSSAPAKSSRSTSRRATVSVLARRSASACALPRPSATASARLANSDGQPEPERDQPGEHRRVPDREDGGEHRADLDDEHDRVLVQRRRVELAKRVGQRRPEHLGVEQAGADAVASAPVRAPCGRWRGGSVVVDISAGPPRVARARVPGSR